MNMDNITFVKSDTGETFEVYATFGGDSDLARIGLMARTNAGDWTFYPRSNEYRLEPNLAKRMVMAAWRAFETAS